MEISFKKSNTKFQNTSVINIYQSQHKEKIREQFNSVKMSKKNLPKRNLLQQLMNDNNQLMNDGNQPPRAGKYSMS